MGWASAIKDFASKAKDTFDRSRDRDKDKTPSYNSPSQKTPSTPSNIDSKGNKISYREWSTPSNPTEKNLGGGTWSGTGFIYNDKYGIEHVSGDYETARQHDNDGIFHNYNGNFGGGYAKGGKKGDRVTEDPFANYYKQYYATNNQYAAYNDPSRVGKIAPTNEHQAYLDKTRPDGHIGYMKDLNRRYEEAKAYGNVELADKIRKENERVQGILHEATRITPWTKTYNKDKDKFEDSSFQYIPEKEDKFYNLYNQNNGKPPTFADILKNMSPQNKGISQTKTPQVNAQAPTNSVEVQTAYQEANPLYSGNSKQVTSPSLSNSMLKGTTGELKNALATFENELNKNGYKIKINSGYRSTEKQQQLYNNRANNPYPVGKPGTSLHEKGNAVDINVYDSKGRKVNLYSDEGKKIIAMSQNAGLNWGGTFKKADPVHFEIRGGKNKTATPSSAPSSTQAPAPNMNNIMSNASATNYQSILESLSKDKSAAEAEYERTLKVLEGGKRGPDQLAHLKKINSILNPNYESYMKSLSSNPELRNKELERTNRVINALGNLAGEDQFNHRKRILDMDLNSKSDIEYSQNPQVNATFKNIENMINDDKMSAEDIYNKIINEMPNQKDVPVLSWDEALKRATGQVSPQYNQAMTKTMDNLQQDLVSRGFFGQVPGAVLQASTAAQIEADKQGSISNLANQLVNQSVEDADRISQRNLQYQQSKLDTLMKALGAYSDRKNTNINNYMNILKAQMDERNYSDSRKDTEWEKDIKNKQLSMQEKQWLAEAMGELDGNPTLAAKKIMHDMGMQEQELAFNMQKANEQISQGWARVNESQRHNAESEFMTAQKYSLDVQKKATEYANKKYVNDGWAQKAKDNGHGYPKAYQQYFQEGLMLYTNGDLANFQK